MSPSSRPLAVAGTIERKDTRQRNVSGAGGIEPAGACVLGRRATLCAMVRDRGESESAHLELEVLVLHLLHVEADRGNRRHHLTDLQVMRFIDCLSNLFFLFS